MAEDKKEDKSTDNKIVTAPKTTIRVPINVVEIRGSDEDIRNLISFPKIIEDL